MQQSLDRLGPINRNLMTGFYKEGHTYEELAQQYGLSEVVVKTRLHRGRKKIRLKEDQYSPI